MDVDASGCTKHECVRRLALNQWPQFGDQEPGQRHRARLARFRGTEVAGCALRPDLHARGATGGEIALADLKCEGFVYPEADITKCEYQGAIGLVLREPLGRCR